MIRQESGIWRGISVGLIFLGMQIAPRSLHRTFKSVVRTGGFQGRRTICLSEDTLNCFILPKEQLSTLWGKKISSSVFSTSS